MFARHVGGVRRGRDDEPVTAEYFACRRIPHHELFVSVLCAVVVVDVDAVARSAAGRAESYFPEPPDFEHRVGATGRRDDIQFIAASAGASQKTLGGQFTLEQLSRHRFYDLFHFSPLFLLGCAYMQLVFTCRRHRRRRRRRSLRRPLSRRRSIPCLPPLRDRRRS